MALHAKASLNHIFESLTPPARKFAPVTHATSQVSVSSAETAARQQGAAKGCKLKRSLQAAHCGVSSRLARARGNRSNTASPSVLATMPQRSA
jgi:hypothetical protein